MSNWDSQYLKKAKRTFVRQLEQSDCGVACLASLIRFYGGHFKLQALREVSGTTRQGTTVLGLVQGGEKSGVLVEAYEADFENLRELKDPTILHVVKDNQMQHFVVCYGYKDGKYLIGDPAEGVGEMKEEDLASIWQSKALLTVEPSKTFTAKKDVRSEKIRWIIELAKDDVNVLLTALFLGIVLSVMGMAVAVFSQKLIDQILPSNDNEKLILGLSLLGFIFVVQAVIGYVRGYFLLDQSRDFNNRIISKFYGTLMILPKAFFDNRKVGELVARMNDTARIQGVLSNLLANILIDFLTMIVATIGVFLYNYKIGLVALFSIPLYITIMVIYNNIIIKRQRLAMHAYAKNEANYVDTIQGIAPIKEGNKEGIFAKLTRQIYGYFQDVQFSLGKLGLHIGLVSGFLTGVLNMTIIAVASFMVLHKTMSIGEMMAIMQMAVSMMIPAVGRLVSVNIQLQEANVAFDRMYEFVGIDPEYDKAKDEEKVQIDKFERLSAFNLSFRFPGRSQLLKDVSFEVGKGEMIALLGESGCGKSTLLQILQRFYNKESGRIVVNGNEWEDVSVSSWRNVIASVPQEIKLFNGSLIDNISMGGILDEEVKTMDDVSRINDEVIQFCQQRGFAEHFDKFPQGVLTILGEEGVNISGGQRQLVGLARAMFQKPQILLLDEATSAMDRKTESAILQLIENFKKEGSVVLVTHRIKTASRADRIYVIEDGIISASGPHNELMKSENFYSLSWQDMTGHLK